jgi:uncharacterized protein HemX
VPLRDAQPGHREHHHEADDGDTGATLGIIGLVLGALGLAAGGTALVQVRRKA